MTTPRTFRELITAWGGIAPIAEDLGVQYVTAQKMWSRDSIAVRYWTVLLEKAPTRGISLSSDVLVRMKAEQVA